MSRRQGCIGKMQMVRAYVKVGASCDSLQCISKGLRPMVILFLFQYDSYILNASVAV